MKKAYYAHCIAIYDSEQESRDIATLEAMGFIVVNPNNEEVQSACQATRTVGGDVMAYFKPMVARADIFVFRALPDGAIPSGVAYELAHAMELEKPVIELPSGVSRRALDYTQTREYLREVGFR